MACSSPGPRNSQLEITEVFQCVSSSVPPCLAALVVGVNPGMDHTASSLRASTYMANDAWYRERTYTRTFSPVAVQLPIIETGKSLPFAGSGTSRQTSAAHCGRHPAGHVMVLGVLLQDEEGCCYIGSVPIRRNANPNPNPKP